MTKVIVCDGCGKVHWASTRLRDLHAYIAQPRTSREAADRFGWSVQNANNKMRALVELGLAEIVDERVQPTGGVENLWQAKDTQENDR